AAELAAAAGVAERRRQLVRTRRDRAAHPRLHQRLPLLEPGPPGAIATRRDRVRRLRVPGGDGLRGQARRRHHRRGADHVRRAAPGLVQAVLGRHRRVDLDAVATDHTAALIWYTLPVPCQPPRARGLRSPRSSPATTTRARSKAWSARPTRSCGAPPATTRS